MITTKIYTIKSGKLRLWQDWCNQINTILKDRATKTLIDEGLDFELFLNFQIENNWYALGIIRANKELKKADLKFEINIKHQAMIRECLAPYSKGELGYFLQN